MGNCGFTPCPADLRRGAARGGKSWFSGRSLAVWAAARSARAQSAEFQPAPGALCWETSFWKTGVQRRLSTRSRRAEMAPGTAVGPRSEPEELTGEGLGHFLAVLLPRNFF